ncbi:alpha/beta hydrolase family protein [Stutzerimonas azotifigens]|uniref:alpha/beta hydrolase family protein n=1 Tax=Stutzerimonas azotifigens TaxID=291995 RepID=UPI0003F84B97|nr:alpha/beta fold hydrolase [Stutzerimonas azotifigens]
MIALGSLALTACGEEESPPGGSAQQSAGSGTEVAADARNAADAGASQEAAAGLKHPSEYLRVTSYPGGLTGADLEPWTEGAPEVEQIEVPSSADGSAQKALYYDSGSEQEKPLLLVLHSWSTNYLQNIDIPIAQFAVANDWVFMHPDFRGQNDGRPESTGSKLAISDMEDALDYAREHANIDESRIYLLGYSGGAMNALHLASRHPDVFAGVSIWVPVYDLVSWHAWNEAQQAKYAGEIAEACGGAPEEGSEAYDACVERSPRTYVPDAAGKLRILIAHGIGDQTVPPDQALHVFNDLAEEEDRIPQEQIDQVLETREIPPALSERSTHDRYQFPRFAEADADILLHLQSGPAELVLFDGEHDMLYRPGLDWLAEQHR